MKKYYLTFVIPLLINTLLGNAITVAGNIVDSKTSKPIPNVNIITDKKSDLFFNKKNILLVKDSLIFLLSIANIKRNIFKGKVIGITGSAGKTTVKENLKFFLLSETKVSASVKSYNNYLGVLISLINLDLNSEFAIFGHLYTNLNLHRCGHISVVLSLY